MADGAERQEWQMDSIRRLKAGPGRNSLVQVALCSATWVFSLLPLTSRRRAGTCDDSACASTGASQGKELSIVLPYITLCEIFQGFLGETEFFLCFHLLPPLLVSGNVIYSAMAQSESSCVSVGLRGFPDVLWLMVPAPVMFAVSSGV